LIPALALPQLATPHLTRVDWLWWAALAVQLVAIPGTLLPVLPGLALLPLGALLWVWAVGWSAGWPALLLAGVILLLGWGADAGGAEAGVPAVEVPGTWVGQPAWAGSARLSKGRSVASSRGCPVRRVEPMNICAHLNSYLKSRGLAAYGLPPPPPASWVPHG
jgi:hypothetical protein